MSCVPFEIELCIRSHQPPPRTLKVLTGIRQGSPYPQVSASHWLHNHAWTPDNVPWARR